MKRLFVAIKIEISPLLSETLVALKQNIPADKIRWVKRDNLHLTLKFLGNVNEQNVLPISQQLITIARTTAPFKLTMEGVGVFQRNSLSGVIYVDIQENEDLASLHHRMNEKLSWFTGKLERKRFSPHLTIARIKEITDRQELKNIVNQHNKILFQQVTVNEFILFESILQRQGPVYTPLHKYSFR